MKRLPLLILLLMQATALRAQTFDSPYEQYAVTPKALEMTRYGHLPPDLNSGRLSFDIPIYTITDGDFSVPVSLHYASSGFQPGRPSGEAGLGWTLMCGGAITREIVGVDDFGEFGLYGGGSVPDAGTVYAMSSGVSYNGSVGVPYLSGTSCECSSDVYRFVMPDHSGSFVLNNDGATFSVYGTADGRGTYTVEVSGTGSSRTFTITTSDGYAYRFGNSSQSREESWQMDTPSLTDQGTAFRDGEKKVVTWLLDCITAPDGRTVHFVYESSRSGVNIPQSGDDVLTGFTRKGGTGSDIGSYKSVSLTYTSYLRRVVTDSTRTSKRAVSLDWERASAAEVNSGGYSGWTRLAVPHRRLKAVRVYHAGSLVRHVFLSYTYDGTRPLLTGVATDGMGSYSMDYLTDASHPLPGQLSEAVDFWGFYNGRDTTSYTAYSPTAVNSSTLDEYLVSDFMNPDWRYSRLGLLSRISYPAGGSTAVTYEANRASKILLRRHSSGGVQPADPELPEGSGSDTTAFLPSLFNIGTMLSGDECGGVRVASLRDSSGTSPVSYRSFTYETQGGASSGTVQQFPRFYAWEEYGTPLLIPSLKYPGSGFDGLHVAYSRVTECLPDSSRVTTVFSDWASDPDSYSGNRVLYSSDLGFPSAYYDFLDNILREPDSRAYRRGRPLSRTSVSNLGQTVREESWTYADEGEGYSAYVLGSGRWWWSTRRFLCDRMQDSLSVTDHPDDGGTPQTRTTHYTYNSYGLPSTVRTRTSDLEEETRLTYITLSGGKVILPDERQVWRGSQLISAKQTGYTTLGSLHHVPSATYRAAVSPGTVSVRYGSADERRNGFDSDGNPGIVTSRDGTQTFLFWKADGQRHPSAAFMGADTTGSTVSVSQSVVVSETQSYSGVSSVTQTFTSAETGAFLLSFTTPTVLQRKMKATLDGVTLTLSSISGLSDTEYGYTDSALPAGQHTLVLTQVKSFSPFDPLSSTVSPQAATTYTFSGTLSFSYIGQQTQTVTYPGEGVYFEDFESSGTAGAGVEGSKGHTGTFSQTLSVGPGRTYVVDWMQKDGNSWGYSRTTSVSTESGLTANITGTAASPIDNVRIYPEGTDAVSWEWNGSAGMALQTDARGITTHFSYDSLGRLSAVTDDLGDPVTAYSYQFTPTDAGGTKITGDIYTSEGGASLRRTDRFFDGLGRPYEEIQRGASTQERDLVSLDAYDSSGRPELEWLPVAAATAGGRLSPSAVPAASQATYGEGETGAYTLTGYDGTPLDRVRTRCGPGLAWHAAARGDTVSYLTSRTAGELAARKISVTLSGQTGVSVSADGLHAAGALGVVKTVDADGRTDLTFTDALERTVLERRIVSDGVYADTYYVYDAAGRLAVVLPPALSALAPSEWDANLDAFAFQRRYDSRGRIIAEKLPGAEWTYTVYDAGDRAVLRQDGNRRQRGRWAFSLQDLLGRNCLSGELAGNFDAFSDSFDTVRVAVRPDGDYGTLHGYKPEGLSLNGADIQAVNWWDSYAFVGADSLAGAQTLGYRNVVPSGYGTRYTVSSQGLLTGTLRAVLDGNGVAGHTAGAVYYDWKGHPVQEAALTHTGDAVRTFYERDFTGAVTGKTVSHASHTEVYTNTYDGWGRPLAVTHSLDGASPETLSSKSYDALGRLAGDARNGAAALATAFSYDVRSSITSKAAGVSGATFSEDLFYAAARGGTEPAAPQWGGNISRADWKDGADGVTRTYEYSYDMLSRLTGASYSASESGWTDNFSRTYAYDLNGNMTGAGSYTGNHLAAGTYDASGNLTQYGGVTTAYNAPGLPATASSQSFSAIYLYDADGTKLRAGVHDAAAQDTVQTDYVGNLIFRDGTLESILVDGGYIDMTGSSPAYRFFITDHLGSVRVVTDAAGAIIRTNHYDPYGAEVVPYRTGTQPAASTAGTDASSRFMFSGNEWEKDPALYDFHARRFNPATASFTSADPLAAKYPNLSPYAYCAGNPVNLVDPDGRKIAVGGNVTYKNKVYAAINHMSAYGVGRVIDHLNDSKETYTIVPDAINSYSSKSRTISWNPDYMKLDESGKIMHSPTVSLAHELGHAENHDRNEEMFKADSNKEDAHYVTVEEKNVIEGIEQDTARALGEISSGEVTRTSHGGQYGPNVANLSPKSQSDKAFMFNHPLIRIPDTAFPLPVLMK